MGEALKRRLKQEKFESPLQEAMLNLLVAANHVRERVDRVCEQYGITNAQYNVLRILRGAHPDGYPRCEIACRMIDRASDITRLIDRLEQQKLVVRDRSDEDRRLSITRITQKGLDLLERMMPSLEEVHRHLGERMSLADRREMSRICEGLYGEEV
jgi:DNA-binding MarR family transcriptional regulator